MKKHYDKILHVVCTFTAMIWLSIWFGIPMAVGTIFALQVIKTIRNYRHDHTYKCYGDWAANLGGYALYAAYRLLCG